MIEAMVSMADRPKPKFPSTRVEARISRSGDVQSTAYAQIGSNEARPVPLRCNAPTHRCHATIPRRVRSVTAKNQQNLKIVNQSTALPHFWKKSLESRLVAKVYLRNFTKLPRFMRIRCQTPVGISNLSGAPPDAPTLLPQALMSTGTNVRSARLHPVSCQ